MKGICLYHKNCADGFAAATAVYHRYGEDYFYKAVQYGDDPPDVSGRDVLIVDFSFKRDVLLQMKKVAKSIVVLDHHKTAEKELEGLDFCKFDMSKSGAVMTWEYLFREPIPKLFEYIQDRDLWKWELPKSREISAALRLVDKNFDLWRSYFDNSRIDSLIKKGAVVLEYQNNCVESVANGDVGKIEIEGYTVPCTNITHLISETLQELAKGQPFAVGYFDTNDKRIYSLRSAPDGVDVSEIARKNGGGGHKHAAGFTRPLPPILI